MLSDSEISCIIGALLKRLGVDEITLEWPELEAMNDFALRTGVLPRQKQVKLKLFTKSSVLCNCGAPEGKHSIACPLGFNSLFPDL